MSRRYRFAIGFDAPDDTMAEAEALLAAMEFDGRRHDENGRIIDARLTCEDDGREIDVFETGFMEGAV